MTATTRQLQYHVAKNSWQDNPLNTLVRSETELPPPALNGVLQLVDWQSPIISAHYSKLFNWLKAGDSQQQANQEGLLQGVLEPEETDASQDQWPIPIPYKRAVSLISHEVYLVNTTLAGQDRFYGADGQVPTYGITERQLSRLPLHQMHIQLGGYILLSQDQIYAGPGQVPTLEERWIVPKGYSRSIDGLSHNVHLVTYTLAGADLFYGAPGQAITFNVEQPLLRRLLYTERQLAIIHSGKLMLLLNFRPSVLSAIIKHEVVTLAVIAHCDCEV